MSDINDDDIWDSNANQRDIELNLHNNEVTRETEKIKKIEYYHGFMEGTDTEDKENYKKGFIQGYNYSLELGLCMGKADSLLKLNELNLIILGECKIKKIKEIKNDIENNTYKINKEMIDKYYEVLSIKNIDNKCEDIKCS